MGYLPLGRRAVQAQENFPVEDEVPLTNAEAQGIDPAAASVR